MQWSELQARITAANVAAGYTRSVFALVDAAASRASSAALREAVPPETSKKMGAIMVSLLNLVETILASARQRRRQ